MARTSAKGRGRIIVIGASAGGFDALGILLRQLPPGFASPIFVVQHISPDATGSVFVEALKRNSALDCKLAQDGDCVQNGRLLIAPPDHHMLIKKGHVLVTKGA